MKKHKDTSHVVAIKNGESLLCRNCGVSYRVNLPIPVTAFTKLVDWFIELHVDCPVPQEKREV